QVTAWHSGYSSQSAAVSLAAATWAFLPDCRVRVANHPLPKEKPGPEPTPLVVLITRLTCGVFVPVGLAFLAASYVLFPVQVTISVPMSTIPILASAIPVPFSTVAVPVSTIPVPASAIPVPASVIPVPVSAKPVPVSAKPVPVSAIPVSVSTIPDPVSAIPIPVPVIPVCVSVIPVFCVRQSGPPESDTGSRVRDTSFCVMRVCSRLLTGYGFVGCLSPCLKQVLRTLSSVLARKSPLQLGRTDVPGRKRSLVVLEPVPCSALQGKVEVLQALLGSPSVMAGHAVVVVDPVLHVLVKFAVEGRRCTRGDGQKHDAGGSKGSLSLHGLGGHSRIRRLLSCYKSLFCRSKSHFELLQELLQKPPLHSHHCAATFHITDYGASERASLRAPQMTLGRSARSQYQTRISYCPQTDVALDLLTGREMLALFARLRGIREQNLAAVIHQTLHFVDMLEYADVTIGTYSGGTRRKLSLAVAFVGNPSVVLLDEPTAAVDPPSRRRIWRILISSRQHLDLAILLSSHCMRECEALCTRLAILAAGRFACLGSTQQLKASFGRGATVLVRSLVEVEPLTTAMVALFPGCYLRRRHANSLLRFHVPGQEWHVLFSGLEALKSDGVLLEYLVSDVSLTEVFLHFSKNKSTVSSQSSLASTA
ncbi:unnamed protein product, partial [Ixodes hexagonus]